MPEDKKRTLLETLRRSIAYAVPVVSMVAVGATGHAIYSDFITESGYQIMAEAEAEAAEAEAEAEGEGESESEGGGEDVNESEAEAE